jgi:hypothetical protein
VQGCLFEDRCSSGKKIINLTTGALLENNLCRKSLVIDLWHQEFGLYGIVKCHIMELDLLNDVFDDTNFF